MSDGRAHACFVLEVCDGVVNSVPSAAAVNSVPEGDIGGGGAGLTGWYRLSLLVGFRHLHRGFMFTQGGAPGQNGRQLTLLILRILSGKEALLAPNTSLSEIRNCSSYWHPLEPLPFTF